MYVGDGSYGGPASVAVSQTFGLREVGLDATLIAGKWRQDIWPKSLPIRGFRAIRIWPRSGWAGLASPGMVSWLLRRVRDYDVVHIHLSRDVTTVVAALICIVLRRPFVVQSHGMILQKSSAIFRSFDWFFIRPILRRAYIVLFLTSDERDSLDLVAGCKLNSRALYNGISSFPFMDEPVGGVKNVLYVSRLHSRKRPELFIEMASILISRGLSPRFSMIGPDEGMGSIVESAATAMEQLKWLGAKAPGDITYLMQQCHVYVLTAVDEPFGMTVLEAMSAGRPVVIPESCGLSDAVREHRAGFVVGETASQFADAVSMLLTDGTLRREMGMNGLRAARSVFSSAAVVEQLGSIYDSAASWENR
ncbi:glycosyltransferase [Rhodococcus sp. 05-2254-6]|uniref:glycosyltransferase n=1 Tax=Rhodococcus sp. 05-2254-6 TaxID=2022489 RepID=UPI00211AD431|nr:glycosyltransferase [Rhodococcus sp. 05-2254-6]